MQHALLFYAGAALVQGAQTLLLTQRRKIIDGFIRKANFVDGNFHFFFFFTVRVIFL